MKIFREKHISKLIAISMLVLIIILAIFTMPQNAAEVNRCKISVVDDGSAQKKQNEDVSVIQKIVASSDKELSFQVDFENYQYQTTQVALVLDNSYSMWSEDKLINSKNSIINLVNNIFSNIENVQMSLSTYDGTKIAMGTDKTAIINAINSITTYDGITEKTGLIYGKDTFTSDDVNKYMILFTDGEEKVSDVVTDVKNKQINLLTAFYGTDKTISNQYKIAGTVYNVQDITEQNLNTVITRNRIENKIWNGKRHK